MSTGRMSIIELNALRKSHNNNTGEYYGAKDKIKLWQNFAYLRPLASSLKAQKSGVSGSTRSECLSLRKTANQRHICYRNWQDARARRLSQGSFSARRLVDTMRKSETSRQLKSVQAGPTCFLYDRTSMTKNCGDLQF